MIGRRAWTAYAVVFVASAGTLVLEIAAGRLLASYFGVSLYTWTSIIGVILAGIFVGNYLGGTAADLAGNRRTLGLVLATAGMASLAILPFTTIDLLGLVPRGLPLVVRMVLATGLLFFAPSALLGMVSPLVVKLTLADLGRAGHVVGRIYAWSTLGSIAGTLLTGFVLIPWVGTRSVIFGVGVVLIALAVVTGEFFRRSGWPRRVDVALVLLLFLNLAQIHVGGALQNWCYRETGYYCIRVTSEREKDGYEYRVLSLDHLIHSYNSIEDPTRLNYPYIRTYAALTAYVAEGTPRLRALFIGGGGYTHAALHGDDLPGRGAGGGRDRSRRHGDGDRDAGAEPRHARGHLQPGRAGGRGGEAGDRHLRPRVRRRLQRLPDPVSPHDPRVRAEDPRTC